MTKEEDTMSSEKTEVHSNNTKKRSSVQEELESLRQQRGMANELKTRLFSSKDGNLSEEVSFANKQKQRQQEERQKELKAVVPRGSMSAVAKMRAAFDSPAPSSPKKTTLLSSPNKKTPSPPPPPPPPHHQQQDGDKEQQHPEQEIEQHRVDKVLPLDEFHRSLKQTSAKITKENQKATERLHHPKDPIGAAKGGGDLVKLGAFYKYDGIDHRGFVFVVHEVHGMMLLHCTRKKKKGPHFQLPGGHVDDVEFKEAARKYPGDPLKQLLEAAKAGAARELWEETGLDVREDLSRLHPATLRGGNGDNGTATKKKKENYSGGTTDGNEKENEKENNHNHHQGEVSLECMLKNRLYFFLSVTNDDFWIKKNHTESEIIQEKLVAPMGKDGLDLLLKLSEEHSGFKFIKDPKISAELLQSHSGGVGREALLMAMTARKGGDKKKKQNGNNNDAAPQKNRSIDLNDAAAEGPVDLLVKPKRKTGLFSCCSFCG